MSSPSEPLRARPPRPDPGTSAAERRRRLGLLAAPLAVAMLIVVVVLAKGGGSSTPARSGVLESFFQDDDHLIYAPPATVAGTLDLLRALGVDRVRATVLWSAIAPAPLSRTRPASFNARDPAAYPAAGWGPYDRLVSLARARGIGVDLDVTAPGPLWAMGAPAPSAKDATHFRPDPAAFGDFVAALGRRYDGHYRGPGGALLPRVSFWTVWNEPNQPGWLYPQWQRTGDGWAMVAPLLYRRLLDAAFAGLQSTGHTPGTDTLPWGELAPEGSNARGATAPIPALTFLRAVMCVDPHLRPLQGAAAAALGCPRGGDTSAFVKAHPALFRANAFAHHPYSFFLPPAAHISDPNFAPLSDLSRLERVLDGARAAYGVQERLPIYLTEYGYETFPPNPFRGVSLARQAQYLDQGQYMAAQDSRVRSMSQFLLYDAAPDTHYPRGSVRYWSTFQTGLLFANGRPKPSLSSYPLPIFLAQPRVPPGSQVRVWAMLRAAPNHTTQTASVQWRGAHGTWRTLRRVTTADPSGILEVSLPVPGSGLLRVAWRSPQRRLVTSRDASVKVG